MKHFGDITKIDGSKVPIVDVITGGSPCQDLSIAGKRAGLQGERSGLFMEQIRVIKEMHDECRRTNKPIRPRIMVWENVCGALSSGTPNGEDFRIVLEETARVVDSNASIPRLPSGESWSNAGCILGDRWSIAWRVHDAQFWGVPQRRRRICLIADFRGQCAPEILFERQGETRNPQQGEKEEPGTPTNSRTGSTISFQERAGCDGGAKESSYNVTEQGPCQQSITNMCSTVAIEGNGQRNSHNGDGYAETDKMYTLNTVERHSVAYSQDTYDKYTETDQAASLRQSGGNYGGVQKRL